jgi:hypothetical protein
MRIDDLDARLFEQLRDPAVDDEQLLVLECAEAVEDRHDPRTPCRVDAVGEFGEEAADEEFGEFVGRGDIGLVDAGLAVDPEPDRHAPLGHGEERSIRSRQRASRERNAE